MATVSDQTAPRLDWFAWRRLAPAWRHMAWAEFAIVALTAAVAWLVENHGGALPAWAPWDFCWPEFLAAAITLLWFLRGLHRISPQARISAWRSGCFLLGLAAIYAVLLTRFEWLAQHMFFLNRVQHAVLHHFGPFLIALSWPGAAIAAGMPSGLRRICTSLARRRVFRRLQNPIVAIFLFEGLLLFWLLPSVTFWAMLDWRLYDVMNASMLLDGLLFWFLVLDPRPRPPAPIGFFPRLALAFIVIFPQIAMGTWLGLTSYDLYPSFSLCGRVFPAIGPLLDQQIGGLILWVPTSMMSAIAALIIMGRLFRHEDSAMGAPAGQRWVERPDGESVLL